MTVFNKATLSRIAVGAAIACLLPAAASAANRGVLTAASGLSSTSGSLLLLGVDMNASGTTRESGGLLTPLTYTMPITKVTVAGSGLSSVSFAGAGLEFDKIFSTKSITFSDLSLDITGKSVLGKVNGTSQVLFTSTGVTGSVTGGTTNGSFSYTASGLKLSTAAATAIGTALGVSATSLGKIGFGSLTVSGVIPEPSTYALIGLGLAAAGAVARRRRETTVH